MAPSCAETVQLRLFPTAAVTRRADAREIRHSIHMHLRAWFHLCLLEQVSHILWARTRGRVSYVADLCRSLTGTSRGAAAAGSGSSGGASFGEVGEDGTWRLRLNEFAHVLKLASRVPAGVEGALQRRLDELPYNARQVVDGFLFVGLFRPQR